MGAIPEEPPAEGRLSYRSALVDRLRHLGEVRAGRLRLRMPRHFGFCWGVDRALAMVEEARAAYPDRPLWLLNSIIHNPRVNRDLLEAGIGFLKGPLAEEGALDRLGPEDVVIVPAFSAEVEEMRLLEQAGVTVVDTTCPWVIKPHKRTLKFIREGFTTVIHGTVGHDETRATCSLVRDAGGHYAVVHDLDEASWLGRFLAGEIAAAELRAGLHPGALSPGLDPERDLRRIGIINQTTMLASESRQVARILRGALVRRHGEEALEHCFRDFDTICNATQENQDAASAVMAAGVDLFLVVGGYDSSNTRNLARVGDDAGVPSYHIEGPHCLEAGEIVHRDRITGELVRARGWLPPGEATVGFTAGASTPDAVLEQVVERVVELAGERLVLPEAV